MPKMITAKANGSTVYVYDERGNMIDTFSFPQNVQVQSYGNGMSVVCGTMCYIYTLDSDGKLRQSGFHGV